MPTPGEERSPPPTENCIVKQQLSVASCYRWWCWWQWRWSFWFAWRDGGGDGGVDIVALPSAGGRRNDRVASSLNGGGTERLYQSRNGCETMSALRRIGCAAGAECGGGRRDGSTIILYGLPRANRNSMERMHNDKGFAAVDKKETILESINAV